MFLDDELDLIWRQFIPQDERVMLLIEACQKRFGNPHYIGIKAWVNNVKKAEFSWQLFAKRHPEIKPDGLRNIVVEAWNETLAIQLNTNAYELFGWKQNSKEHKQTNLNKEA